MCNYPLTEPPVKKRTRDFLFSGRLPVLAVIAVSTALLPAQSNRSSSQLSYLSSSSSGTPESSSESSSMSGDPSSALPSAPEPSRDHNERFGVPYAANETFGFLSRIGVGADVGPLGIGIKGAVVLTPSIDGRLDTNFFSYQSGHFDIDGWNVTANLHMASTAAKLDWYPFNSVWRLSPGIMLFNGNELSGKGFIAGGTSFSINGKTYYSAKDNPATGATPLNGNGLLGFHRHQPAFTLTGGFGRFIPRSHRHWSFPSEFGVVFTGAPTVDVKLAGWACTDKAETDCGDVNSPSSSIGNDFNSNLNTALARWRHDLSGIQVYPVFTYSVVYSFTLPR